MNIPCAVSGRRYATLDASDAAPTVVENMRLKSRGIVRVGLPEPGDGTMDMTSSDTRVRSTKWNGLIFASFFTSFSLRSFLA